RNRFRMATANCAMAAARKAISREGRFEKNEFIYVVRLATAPSSRTAKTVRDLTQGGWTRDARLIFATPVVRSFASLRMTNTFIGLEKCSLAPGTKSEIQNRNRFPEIVLAHSAG